jgi:hypothetical protein
LTPYVYATLEGLHLVGVAFFFGSIFLLDLRLLGLMPQIPHRSIGRFLLGICVPAFMLLAVSGIFLFIPSADRYAASPVFLVKMGVIVLGGVNALALHISSRQRLAAAVSVLLWIVVIALGRAMGYEPRQAPDVEPGTILWLD